MKMSFTESSAKPYVKQEPYVGEDGIYMPLVEYVEEGCRSHYRLVITKELFIEAYEKWIGRPAAEQSVQPYAVPQDWMKLCSDSYIPEPCRGCPNHPSNGGSGICNCTLGQATITCTTNTTGESTL